jgi:hypothetical protein
MPDAKQHRIAWIKAINRIGEGILPYYSKRLVVYAVPDRVANAKSRAAEDADFIVNAERNAVKGGVN